MNNRMQEYVALVNLLKPNNLSDTDREKLAKATLVAERRKIDLVTFKNEVERFFGRRN